MGILRKGIFDGFENKTGPLVGRKIKGRNIISALPHKTESKSTQAQLDQQKKFELVAGALKRLRRLIATGFKQGNKNAFSAAMKYNFKRLITGSSPDFGIDYSKLVFSKGSLAGPNAPVINLGINTVMFSWQPDTQTQFNQYTDKANFVIYCPAKNAFVLMIGGASRENLGYNMAIPANFEGHEMYCFMSFTSADGKAVSDSIYLGTI